MKCQNRFSGKNKKNISKCRLLIFLPTVQSVQNVVKFRERRINNFNSVSCILTVSNFEVIFLS